MCSGGQFVSVTGNRAHKADGNNRQGNADHTCSCTGDSEKASNNIRPKTERREHEENEEHANICKNWVGDHAFADSVFTVLCNLLCWLEGVRREELCENHNNELCAVADFQTPNNVSLCDILDVVEGGLVCADIKGLGQEEPWEQQVDKERYDEGNEQLGTHLFCCECCCADFLFWVAASKTAHKRHAYTHKQVEGQDVQRHVEHCCVFLHQSCWLGKQHAASTDYQNKDCQEIYHCHDVAAVEVANDFSFL